VRSAIRQRTRWVTGISLQTWDRHGWTGSAGQIYWLWRDRKGLIGNPLSLAANVVFLWTLATCWWTTAVHPLDPRLAFAILPLLLYRMAIRMVCVGRIYGPMFSLAVPLRSVCANYINAMASFHAMFHFARAKIRRQPLVWLKTEHGYPSRNTLLAHKRDLGEILTGSGYISEEDLREALRDKPPEMLLGWYLVLRGKLDESDLFEAISLQQGLPMGALAAADVSPNAARALPRHLVQTWRVLPFSIKAGALHLATSRVPTDEMTRELRGFTGLNVRFQLVTTENFEMLLDLL
jgi:adsorption protein B